MLTGGLLIAACGPDGGSGGSGGSDSPAPTVTDGKGGGPPVNPDATVPPAAPGPGASGSK
jgi:hypothetical protein